MPWFEVSEEIMIPYPGSQQIKITVPVGLHWVPEDELRAHLVQELRASENATEDYDKLAPS